MNDLSIDQKPEGWDPVAKAYDVSFALFTALFAQDVQRLTNVQPGQRILDVAAGTGALSLAAAEAGAEVLATDFSPGMVDYLRSKVEGKGIRGIRVAVMDGQALDLEDGSFDAAFSIFGLTFFPDRSAGFRELCRVIKTGGRAAVVSWGATERVRFMHIIVSALKEVVPDFPAPKKPPLVLSLADRNTFKSEMQAGGFAYVNMFTVAHIWTFSSPDAVFNSLDSAAPPMARIFNNLAPNQREAFRRALNSKIQEEQQE
jgi:ubiquinone/menaquinone biosynthesis C-methylase UbiE